VGIGGIQRVPSVCIGVALEVGVASLIIVGHRGEGGLMGKFKRGGAAARAGEAVDFGHDGLSWVVIRLRGGRGRRARGGFCVEAMSRL
jgi:hypothetical protein